ncbi:MAG: hypothetical protein EPN88_11190 [Bacteroidetes bacterium]|nr:MAG: hypothetical protein EPN88_11190 [Bacteroidota bacterium]
MRSKFFSLNSRDFIKGLIVVVICTFLTGVYQLVANGGTVNWLTVKPVVIAAFGAAVSYLTKNLLTNSDGDFMKGETK